jgi:hypothetical protein
MQLCTIRSVSTDRTSFLLTAVCYAALYNQLASVGQQRGVLLSCYLGTVQTGILAPSRLNPQQLV